MAVYRSVDPRAEAMGEIQSVGEKKHFSLLSNPALDNSGREISAYFSYSDYQNYFFGKAKERTFGVTYNTGTIGSFGASMGSFSYNDVPFRLLLARLSSSIWIDPAVFSNFLTNEELYSLSYSNKISDIVNVGVTANLLVYNEFKNDFNAFYDFIDNKSKTTNNAAFFDIGLSKKFSMYEDEKRKYELNAGLQVTNVTGNKIRNIFVLYNPYNYNQIITLSFPSILRIGIENVLTFYKDNKDITLKTAIEYEDFLNAKTFSAIKFGAELSALSDLLSLRAGYYYRFAELKGTYDNPSYDDLYSYPYLYNYHFDYSQGHFTYGVGLNLDFKRLLNWSPIILIIDFVSIDPTFTEKFLPIGGGIFSSGDFQTVLARFKYIIE
jgi:uncharacterized protein YfkK (UPF0435 family)